VTVMRHYNNSVFIAKKFSNHSMVSKSKSLVGSSIINKSGFPKELVPRTRTLIFL
jgi:hypothetical protein